MKLFEYQVTDAGQEKATKEKEPKNTAQHPEQPLTGGAGCFFLKCPESLLYFPDEAVRAAAVTFSWLENAAMGTPHKSDGVWYARVYNGGWVSTQRIADGINERARALSGTVRDVVCRRTVIRHLEILKREGFIKKVKKSNAGLVIAVRVWPAGEPVSSVDNSSEECQPCHQEVPCESPASDMRVTAYIREQETEQELKKDPEALTLVENPEKERQQGESWVSPAKWRALRERVAQTVEESLSVPLGISNQAREERCRVPRDAIERGR